MPSCVTLPHGAYSLVPAALTTMAWIASLFQNGCDFSRLTGSIVQKINPDVPFLEVGFAAYREPTYNAATKEWQVVYTGNCLDYPGDVVQQDAYWNVSKAFEFIALVLGGGGTFFLWCSTCCVFSRGTWRWAGCQVGLAAVAQALAFMWFGTAVCRNNNCALFWGSKASIVAASFWTTAALCIALYYPVPKEMVGSDGLVLVERSNRTRPSVALSDDYLGGTGVTGDEMNETRRMSSGQNSREERREDEQLTRCDLDKDENELI